MKITVTFFFIALLVLGSHAATFTLTSTALTLCQALTGNCDLTSTTSNLFGLLGLPGASDDVVLSPGTSPIFLSIGKAVAWGSLTINGSASAVANLNISSTLSLSSASVIGAYSNINIQAGGVVTAASSLNIAANAIFNTAATSTLNVASALTIAASSKVNFAGSVVVNATTSISGSASFSGSNQLNGGLNLQSGGALTFTGGASAQTTVQSSFQTASNTTLLVDLATNVTATAGATVSGTLTVKGNLIAQGSGYTQAGGVLGGVGHVVGNVVIQSGANISAGLSPGIIYVDGNLNLNAGSTTVIEADGNTYDQIVVGGTATINGILAVKFLNGYQPSGQKTFTAILAYQKETGSFTITTAEGWDFFTSKVTVSYGSLTTDMTYTPNGVASVVMSALLLSFLLLV